MNQKKRKKMLPVEAICRNCNTRLYGRYCHSCGQDLFKGTKRTLGSMAFHSLENILSIDNKFFETMKYLLFRPGKLTKEYTNGRIVRYVHPSKLFWFISILFFFLLTTQIVNGDASPDKKKENIEMVEMTTISPDTSAITNNPKDTILQKDEIIISHSKDKKSKKEKKKKTEEKIDLEKTDSKLASFKDNFMKYAPYASFLLIPFFALLLNLFFNKRDLFYVDHLVFALHFHAFIFFLFTLFIIASMIFPNYDFEVYFFFYIPIIYLIWAIWVVYRPRIRTLVFKITAIFVFYGIAIISVIISLFIIAAKLSKMDEVLKEAMSYTQF